MNNTLKVLGGILLGAAAGTAAGILMAPDDGKKTRKALSKKTDELRNELTNLLNKSIENFKQTYNTRLEDYTDSGHKALDNIKDSVKAKDGAAEKVKETLSSN